MVKETGIIDCVCKACSTMTRSQKKALRSRSSSMRLNPWAFKHIQIQRGWILIFYIEGKLLGVYVLRFGEVLKDKEAEGKEKHVPTIEIDKGARKGVDIVRVIVGKETPHPNTVEHHIGWVELYGVKKDGQVINLGRAAFAPVYTAPNVRFQVSVEEFKAFHALAYCNIHGVWENSVEVE